MYYIFDVLLDFNNELYDFYEWYSKDKIENFKKIPIFRISDDDLYNLINYKVNVSKDFLNKIYKKSEGHYGSYRYASLFTNNKKIFALEFGSDGSIKNYSSLLPDEEDDILMHMKKLNILKLDYKISNIKVNAHNKVRYIDDISTYNKKYLENLYKNKMFDEVNYLYSEVYDDGLKNDIKYKYDKLRNSNYVIKLNKVIKETQRKLNNLT